MEVSGQLHVLATLPRGDRTPGTHWIGGWVGPRASLDAVAKRKIPSLHWKSNPNRPNHPAHILVAILTELSWILKYLLWENQSIMNSSFYG
jgi:hypothetical protein